MGQEFVGAGIAFPFRTDATGRLELVDGDAEIRESVRLILGTARGERPMRPAFGCGIHDLVFAPSNAGTAGRAAYEVRVALERWEPRIEVDDVTATFDQDVAGTMYVTVAYRIAGTNDPRNLVFPFYTIPAED
jgi:phage baseplate assembly protein W